MKKISKMLVALGAGLAIGGILGVLFAPDKGSETRRKISKQGKKVAAKLKSKLKEGREELESRFTKANGKVEELS